MLLGAAGTVIAALAVRARANDSDGVDWPPLNDRIDRLNRWSSGLAIGGALAAAVGGGILAWTRPPSPPPLP